MRRTVPQIDRLMSKVEKTADCWLFTGARLPNGYGVIRAGRRGERGERLAHRASYVALVGPIPAGVEIDHLCSVRNCVRPDHLEVVTHAENMRRTVARGRAVFWNAGKTHCPKGHPYDEANTFVRKCGRKRLCRECMRAGNRTRPEAG
jgi:hypothetical protein